MGFLVHFYRSTIKRDKNYRRFIDNKHFLNEIWHDNQSQRLRRITQTEAWIIRCQAITESDPIIALLCIQNLENTNEINKTYARIINPWH